MKRLDIQIIDYISGEMNDLDRIAFEQLMESDPSIKSQVQEMQSTQSDLASWDDKMIDVPDFEVPQLEVPSNKIKTLPPRRISPWLKYAASAAAIISLLWVSGLQINTSSNGITLSIGVPTSPADNIDERIDQAVSNALEKYSKNQTAQLAQISNQIGSEIESVKTSINTASGNWKSENSTIQNMMNSLSEKQFARLKNIVNENQLAQHDKMDAYFADLMEYIDDKRIDDLQEIQGAFTEIVATIEEQQQRTDEIFQGLVQPVAVDY